MKVPGNSSSTRFSAITPSTATPWNLRRQGEMSWWRAIASTAMKPMLWRLPA